MGIASSLNGAVNREIYVEANGKTQKVSFSGDGVEDDEGTTLSDSEKKENDCLHLFLSVSSLFCF